VRVHYLFIMKTILKVQW